MKPYRLVKRLPIALRALAVLLFGITIFPYLYYLGHTRRCRNPRHRHNKEMYTDV